MAAIAILIFICIALVVSVYVFGDGAKSQRNKGAMRQVPIKINSVHQKILEIGGSNRDNTAYPLLAVYNLSITHAVFNALSQPDLRQSDLEASIQQRYDQSKYDYEALGEMFLGYALGVLCYQTHNPISKKSIIRLVKALKVSSQTRKRILEEFNFVYDDFKLSGTKNYIGLAENRITHYLLSDNPKWEQSRLLISGDPFIGSVIRADVLFTLKGLPPIINNIATSLED